MVSQSPGLAQKNAVQRLVFIRLRTQTNGSDSQFFCAVDTLVQACLVNKLVKVFLEEMVGAARVVGMVAGVRESFGNGILSYGL